MMLLTPEVTEYILSQLLHKYILYQPSHDVEEHCTAMILTSRLDIIGWVKLLCSHRLPAHFICSTADTDRSNWRTVRIIGPRGGSFTGLPFKRFEIFRKRMKGLLS